VNEAVAAAVDPAEFALDDAGDQLLRGFEQPIRVSRLSTRVESSSIV
jgi:hypothetical protein